MYELAFFEQGSVATRRMLSAEGEFLTKLFQFSFDLITQFQLHKKIINSMYVENHTYERNQVLDNYALEVRYMNRVNEISLEK